jgi:hypothetical protein
MSVVFMGADFKGGIRGESITDFAVRHYLPSKQPPLPTDAILAAGSISSQPSPLTRL